MADSPRFTLYMSGTSYYAQKVLLALFEKKEPFTEKLVKNPEDENYEPWFMKMNPAGKIPVLDDRGKIILESEDIIDYLDAQIPRAPRLVPDPSTELGKEVVRFRKLLDANVFILTYGIAYNPNLAPEGKAEKNKSELDAAIDGKVAKLQKLASDHPELRDAYLAKIPPLREIKEDRRNPDVVQKEMDSVQVALDQVEDRIVKSSEGATGETWLLGSDFTVADINLTVLLRRLSRLGLSSLYFTSTKRPALYKYWQKLQTYPSFCKLIDIGAKYAVKA